MFDSEPTNVHGEESSSWPSFVTGGLYAKMHEDMCFTVHRLTSMNFNQIEFSLSIVKCLSSCIFASIFALILSVTTKKLFEDSSS